MVPLNMAVGHIAYENFNNGQVCISRIGRCFLKLTEFDTQIYKKNYEEGFLRLTKAYVDNA